MKLALTLLPLVTLMSVVSVQTQAANPVNSNKIITLSNADMDDEDDTYVSSQGDINEAIQKLSQQAQQKEDRLASLAQKLSTQSSVTIINNASLNGYSNYSNNPGNGMLSVRPITSSARMSSGFGYRVHPVTGKTQFHKGMDFAAPVGTPIYATGNGVVTFSGWGNGYGRYIEIDHGNGVVTRYAHNSANYVNVGDTVSANQRIGAVGSTGRSTGPHLHYEVRQRGQAVNPQTYLALAPAR